MAWRYHGRARVSASNPSAFGVCDRCKLLYNLNKLTWQFDWAGPRMINKRILVCHTCLDVPQQQLRTIVIPVDPPPVLNARPEAYAIEVPNFLITENGIPLITENGLNLVAEETGDIMLDYLHG